MRLGEFEVVKIGARKFDLADPYHLALTVSWPVFWISALGVWALAAALFAIVYLAFPDLVATLRPGDATRAFFFSFQTLTSATNGPMYPQSVAGFLVTTVQTVTGIIFTAVMTGLVFVRFSKPRPKILFADAPVIAIHNSRPHLMIRIGNGRANPLADVSASLACLVRETTHEGTVFYNVYELRLQRTRTPVFPLTIVLMHEIDSTSPLFGRTLEAMAEAEMRLFLTVEARDPLLGAVVSDLRTYGAEKIASGMRYADLISKDEDGRNVADLTRISLTEPDAASIAPAR